MADHRPGLRRRDRPGDVAGGARLGTVLRRATRSRRQAGRRAAQGQRAHRRRGQGGAGRPGAAFQRAWHRHRLQHGERQAAGQRRAGQGAVPGGAGGQGRRPAGGGRPAHLQGGAGPGRGHADAEPGATEERRDRPAALQGAVRRGLDRQADPGYPGSPGPPVAGHHPYQPGPGRRRPPQPDLHRGPRTDFRAPRPAPGGHRQPGHQRRYHAAGGDHPGQADLGGVQPAAAADRHRRRADERPRQADGHRAGPQPGQGSRRRHPDHPGQPDRHHHRHGQAQGALRERRRQAVPQPVRQRAPAGADPQGRADHSGQRRAARHQRYLCVRGRRRQQGQPAQRRHRHQRERAGGGGKRPEGRRAGGGGRHRPPARRYGSACRRGLPQVLEGEPQKPQTGRPSGLQGDSVGSGSAE